MIKKSFPLTVVVLFFIGAPLMAERDWKKKDSGKHPGTEPERSASNRDEKRASRVLTVRDITIFTYQPAPTRPIDSRSLRDEGLARVSINEQGTVTLVKLLRSSGNREYDTEAVDAFRRWRAGRGSAREIDLPLTAVTTGKKGPVRIPLTQGTFTSG